MMVEEVAGDRHRRWFGLVVAVAVVAAAAGFGLGLTRSALRATPWPFDLHAVGEGCPDDAAWVCGSIRVPLDRAAPNAKSISIHFRVLPRRDRFATPTATIVVVNGGPGFPSTDLHAWAQKAFGSLLGDHDLLLVDNRGTGASGRIDCPDAQKSITFATVAKCRTILGPQADDYGTVAAVDDLEAVLERIHARNVDLYGESYGTFFAQVFALRHPQLLQRMVLDGALPLAVDPWARDSLPAGLADLRTTCSADATCRASGDPVALLAKVLARLRVGIPAPYISRRAFDLGLLVANAGRAGSAYRELPAATRAYLAGDQVPLLRLVSEAQTLKYGSDSASDSPGSQGLFVANSCPDWPHPFDLPASLAEQKRQLAAAYKSTRAAIAHAVLPFTSGEALANESWCLGWPAPTGPTPQTLGRNFPDVPTLVLEGGLDTVTAARGARSVAHEFPQGRYVEVPFVGHVAAPNDESGCAARIAAQFLAATGPLDTTCLARGVVPPEVGAFPTSFAQEAPVTANSHLQQPSDLSANDRRTIAIARDAVADVMWRWAKLHEEDGHGLRGGTFESASPPGSTDLRVELNTIRWTTDTTVTGEIITYEADHSLDGVVDISTPAGRSHLEIHSPNALGPSTIEQITGTINGREINTEVDAKLGL